MEQCGVGATEVDALAQAGRRSLVTARNSARPFRRDLGWDARYCCAAAPLGVATGEMLPVACIELALIAQTHDSLRRSAPCCTWFGAPPKWAKVARVKNLQVDHCISS